jgi:hypothetical protein
MMELRERVNAQSTYIAIGTPTSYRTEINRYPLYCGVCHDLFYVDERIVRQVYAALEDDELEMPFSCWQCQEPFV